LITSRSAAAAVPVVPGVFISTAINIPQKGVLMGAMAAEAGIF
jgi:hypothetical protein